MEVHAYKQSYVYAEADWMGIIHPGTRIHILHGGTADEHGVYACARHLQGVWRAGVVWAASKEHLMAIVRAAEAGSSIARLIVVVCTQAIAAYPAGYDALLRVAHVTVVVAAPLASIRGEAYSAASNIVAVMLPSCRVSMDCVRVVATVYRFPEDTVMLEQSLWQLPHGMGLAWTVGKGAPLCVSFLDAVGPAAASQQDVVDRLFWWAAPARPVHGLPAAASELVTTKGCPFYPAHGAPPERVSATHLRIRSSMDSPMLLQARSNPSVCNALCDFHVVDEDGRVHPVQLSLGGCVDEVLPGDTMLSGEVEQVLYFTGACTFPGVAAATAAAVTGGPPLPPSPWKQYTASLPEL